MARNVQIGVFGATSAGKTHLISAGVVALYRLAQRDGCRVTFDDPADEETLTKFVELVEQGHSTTQTQPGIPAAFTMQVDQPLFPALISVYDAAGTALDDPELNRQFRYLDHTHTLIFVLDPFSVPGVRDQVAPEMLERANAATDDPEGSYQATAGRLRLSGVETKKQRLAFVVSKADLLAETAVWADAGPDSLEEWLKDQGLTNLVVGAKRDFLTSFFLCSAVDLDHGHPDAPFRWLLQSEGVAIG